MASLTLSLAFNSVDLTKFIQKQLKHTFFNNAMRLFIVNKDVTYKFESTGREKRVNSILYQTRSTLSQLMNIPLSNFFQSSRIIHPPCSSGCLQLNQKQFTIDNCAHYLSSCVKLTLNCERIACTLLYPSLIIHEWFNMTKVDITRRC